ncbi:MAG: hypothetical protein QOD92_1597 [Acidimicrobiaceae bacterium]
MIRRLAAAAIVTVACVFVFGVQPASALPCGDAHNATSTEATVNADGSMDVVETLSFDFDDGCHGGIRELDLAPISADDTLGSTLYDIGPITVTESGESVPIADARPGFVKWGEADVTISGHHEYELSYRVTNAVAVSPDVAILYWQFLGGGSPRQDHVEVTIHTPGTGDGVRIFVHGALNGVVDPPRRDVHLVVDDNPKGTKVEVRMLEPASDFAVAPSGPPLEQAILEKEAQLAGAANERRAELRDQLDREARLETAGNIAGPVLAVLGLLAFTGIFFKWGKEPPPPPDISEYWREIPDDPPAVCQAVRTFGSVSNDAFSATLIDLAQRGWLTIAEEHSETAVLHRDKTDYRFTRTPKADAPLTDYESKLLWRLFPNGGTITQSELVADAKSTPKASAAWLDDFKSSIHADFARRGYVDQGHLVKWLLHFFTIVAVGGLGVLAVAAGAMLGWLAIGVAVVLVPLSLLLRQRTQAGARKLAEVDGLAHFLRDFSRLPDEAHTGDLILYERYLVYAVALGVSQQLVEGLRVRFPQFSEPNSGFATWYVVGSVAGYSNMGRLDSIGTIGSFASEFSDATAAAFSPPSSSSGSGGGFSGGGGGGGGGGGSGGW